MILPLPLRSSRWVILFAMAPVLHPCYGECKAPGVTAIFDVVRAKRRAPTEVMDGVFGQAIPSW